VRKTATIARLEIEAAQDVVKAGGRDSTVMSVRAFSADGSPVRSGSVTIETTAGQWLVPKPKRGDGQNARGSIDVPDGPRTGTLPIRDGIAQIALQSDLAPSTAHIRVLAEDGSNVEARTNVRFDAARSMPVIAAVGEVGIGRGEAATADADETGDVHGTGAL